MPAYENVVITLLTKVYFRNQDFEPLFAFHSDELGGIRIQQLYLSSGYKFPFYILVFSNE